MERYLSFVTNGTDIVLDMFAGSGTLADGVMRLNQKDKGSRRHISIQYPEKIEDNNKDSKLILEFCEKSKITPVISEITKERLRRAGKRIITKAKEEKETNIADIGFRVFKIDSSNMADVYYEPNNLFQDLLANLSDNIKSDRTSEDLLIQVLVDWGVDLSLPIIKEKILKNEVLFVDNNSLVACFETNGKITEDFCREIAARKPARVVFRDSGFKDDSVKINVDQIFKLMSPSTQVKTI